MYPRYGYSQPLDIVNGTLHREGGQLLDDLAEEFRSGRAFKWDVIFQQILNGEFDWGNPEINAIANEIYWDARWYTSEAINVNR